MHNVLIFRSTVRDPEGRVIVDTTCSSLAVQAWTESDDGATLAVTIVRVRGWRAVATLCARGWLYFVAPLCATMWLTDLVAPSVAGPVAGGLGLAAGVVGYQLTKAARRIA